MATKYRMGEALLKLLSQNLQDSKVTMQEAMLFTSQAANKYIREMIWQNKAMGETTIPYYALKDYEIDTQLDESRDMLYAKLPIRTLDNVYQNMGIFQVVPCNDYSQAMIPLNKGFLAMYRNMPSYGIEGNLGFIPERDRIYIYGADPTENIKIVATLIPDCTALNPDEEMPLPTDAETDVLNLAISQLQITLQIPQDMVTNNKYENI